MLEAMQQHFERLNVIFGEFRDRMDRQDILVANLQRNEAGRNADRRRPPDHDPLQIDESEDENGERGGNGEEHEERYRGRGLQHRRGYRRNDRNQVDNNLGNIKFKILPFQGKNDPEFYLEWDKKV